MFSAIRYSLSDVESSNNGEDGEDAEGDEADPEVGKMIKDDKPSWLLRPIAKTVRHRMEHFRYMQLILSKWTATCLGDTAVSSHQSDMKYVTTELNFPAVVQQQTDDNAVTS
jgi:hypothetical protein